MPFEQHDRLEDRPNVRIFFTGLNILKGEDNKCKVLVHNRSDPHTLSIEVRRKRPNQPDVLMMRHHGRLQPVGGDPTTGFVIRTLGLEPGETGVKAYNGKEASSEGTKLGDSFSLAELLGEVPDVDEAGGRPCISINHGTFYTARKVTVEAQFINVETGEPVKHLDEVPTIIGANIYLNPGNLENHVQLRWRQQGQDVHLNLMPSEDFTYEIYVVNEPLFIPDTPEAPRHGEFEEYFKLLPGVPKSKQIELKFIGEPPDRGSNRSPCMSIVLDNNAD